MHDKRLTVKAALAILVAMKPGASAHSQNKQSSTAHLMTCPHNSDQGNSREWVSDPPRWSTGYSEMEQDVPTSAYQYTPARALQWTTWVLAALHWEARDLDEAQDSHTTTPDPLPAYQDHPTPARNFML